MNNKTSGNHSPETLLQKHFGYSTFRPQQKEIIQHVIDGKDAVVFVNAGIGKQHSFRGICAKVIQSGDISVGDVAQKST